ncbi:GABA permease-like protein [Xylariomycetidae sp. FL2044]|nr:GABA permease-like protein [Xylariomycetidae sp. FL2044]
MSNEKRSSGDILNESSHDPEAVASNTSEPGTEDNLHNRDAFDSRDMYRMGKKQEFRRIFGFSTTIMFTSMIQSTWEVVLIAPNSALVNGGLPMLFWGYIWTSFGFIFIVLFLGEMASMGPTSGGQYHWVSEFAPRKYQRLLSYISGWLATTSWQAGTAGGAFFNGTLLQGMIAAYDRSYIPTRWQGTLFVLAICLVQGIVNTLFVSQLPTLQKISFIPHVLGWIPVVAVLWTLAPQASASDVFLNWQSLGGWKNTGVSVLVGSITLVYFLICSDCAAHVAEEVDSAARSVPRAMLWSFSLNAAMGFVVFSAFIFALPDVDAALDPQTNPSGYAFIYVFQRASHSGGIVLFTIIEIVSLTGIIGSNAATSRQTFAFARDGGLPFGDFLSKVTKVRGATVPLNAVIVTCVISALLSLINIGSTVAINAIISLQLMALMATYTISIGCVLYQRTLGGGKQLPSSRCCFCHSVFLLVWTPWPGTADPATTTFNWSIVMFAAVLIMSVVYFLLGGRKYQGPVALVKVI